MVGILTMTGEFRKEAGMTIDRDGIKKKAEVLAHLERLERYHVLYELRMHSTERHHDGGDHVSLGLKAKDSENLPLRDAHERLRAAINNALAMRLGMGASEGMGVR